MASSLFKSIAKAIEYVLGAADVSHTTVNSTAFLIGSEIPENAEWFLGVLAVLGFIHLLIKASKWIAKLVRGKPAPLLGPEPKEVTGDPAEKADEVIS